MTRKELRKATDGDIIVEYVLTAAKHAVNQNSYDRGIARLAQHLRDLDAEMLRRGILSQEQIDRLNT